MSKIKVGDIVTWSYAGNCVSNKAPRDTASINGLHTTLVTNDFMVDDLSSSIRVIVSVSRAHFEDVT